MTGILQRRLQLQLLFILLAAVSVAALSALLVYDSLRSAETTILSDTHRELASAIRVLGQRYTARVASDLTWPASPTAVKNASLRALSEAVLDSYPGVEGGYFAGSDFLGYSFPTHENPSAKTDVPQAERDAIKSVVVRSRGAGTAERVLRGGDYLVVIQAQTVANANAVAWTMKRLTRSRGGIYRSLLLLAFVLAALLCIGATLTLGIGLRRGVVEIQAGLRALEADFTHQLPERSDELGSISRAINQMASVRRRLEADLGREDRLRAVGRMVAGITHEIRNPLNGIRLSMQSLELRLKNQAVRHEDLELVIEEVDRMEALLSDLLPFQHRSVTQVADQPLLPVVERCIHLVEPQTTDSHASIHLRAPDAALNARFDSRALTQVLTNLLINAIEAESGKAEIDVGLEKDGEFVAIVVHDNGPGLSADQREHIFEAFYTTKPEGTGLGLAVSRELVEAMGGRLTYRDGHPGTTFVIQLPQVSHEQG
jgi:signal transduction histidine kinase